MNACFLLGAGHSGQRHARSGTRTGSRTPLIGIRARTSPYQYWYQYRYRYRTRKMDLGIYATYTPSKAQIQTITILYHCQGLFRAPISILSGTGYLGESLASPVGSWLKISYTGSYVSRTEYHYRKLSFHTRFWPWYSKMNILLVSWRVPDAHCSCIWPMSLEKRYRVVRIVFYSSLWLTCIWIVT